MAEVKKDWNSDPSQGFYEWAEKHKYSEKTIKVYSSIFHVYIRFLEKHNIALKDVSKTNITTFVKTLNVNDKSKKMYLWLISDIYNDMVGHGEIDDNPAEYILKNLRKDDRSKSGKRIPLALTETESIKLIEHLDNFKNDYANTRRKCAILLMMGSGLRVEELCSLTMDGFNLEEKNPVIKVIGKFDKERLVPVPKSVVDTLNDFIDLKRTEGKLSKFFLSSQARGNPYTTMGVYLLVRRTLAAAGIMKSRMSPHILRHTFATRNIAAGIALTTVKLWLGHESIASTAIYEHVTVATDSAAVF